MSNKKEIRRNFREVCLKRDKLSCKMCGFKVKSFEIAEEIFDIHHITDRSLMPHGGYCLENGITLCKDPCHKKAEEFHSTGVAYPGYSPDDLYKIINSNLEKAIEASEKLSS
jgi:5-methylcytosine-specific restriction endonuclease McrA